MKQIFISDLHLDEGHVKLRSGLFNFLAKHCQDADELYILGDFFEVWLGDDHDSAFNRSIVEALSQQPGQVFLMHGNRDFLLGEDFCTASGATMLPDPSTIATPLGPALLMHGDSLCTQDEAYMAARSQLRAPAFKADFLSRSITDRAAYARQLRGESKSHTRETAADIMDVTPQEVIRHMHRAHVQIMIHGHTHRPATHDLEPDVPGGLRYVLGDWHDTMQYLEITANGASLERFVLA